MMSLFDKDIALKIEVMEEGGPGRTAVGQQKQQQQYSKPEQTTVFLAPQQIAVHPGKVSLVPPVKRKKKAKLKDKLSRTKNYQCVECGTGFVSTKDLARHRVVHTGEKPYSCPYCDQKFTAPSSRATHIRSIHEKSQEFLCPECEKPFNQKSNMVKHYKTIHLETVVIVCQQCGRDFNQASALRRHIKIVHKKELPHACQQCGKRFALAESLKKHMEAIHLKSRAYPCTYCDYAASRADMLKIHIRKIHTKEWSYKCEVCEGKGTPWGCILPKELRRHLQTRHPGESGELQTAPARQGRAVTTTVSQPAPAPAPLSVEERAMRLLEEIRHPLAFSAQLEAEVRARACHAPASVLGTAPSPDPARVSPSNEADSPQIFLEQKGGTTVLYDWGLPSSGTAAGAQYTSVEYGEESFAVAQEPGDTVVVESSPGAELAAAQATIPSLRLLYDFPRS